MVGRRAARAAQSTKLLLLLLLLLLVLAWHNVGKIVCKMDGV